LFDKNKKKVPKPKDNKWVIMKGLQKTLKWDGIGWMKMCTSEVNFHFGEDGGTQRRQDNQHCVVQLHVKKLLSKSDQIQVFKQLEEFLEDKISYKMGLIHQQAHYLTVFDNEIEGSEEYKLPQLKEEIENKFPDILELKLVDEWTPIPLDRWRGDELEQFVNL
jgi:hypothetical protein